MALLSLSISLLFDSSPLATTPHPPYRSTNNTTTKMFRGIDMALLKFCLQADDGPAPGTESHVPQRDPKVPTTHLNPSYNTTPAHLITG